MGCMLCYVMLCAPALPQFSYNMLIQGHAQDFRNADVTV